MTLRVVGAGLGRTGTMSLKVALHQLLEGPCYHMMDVFARQEHIPIWEAAAKGQMPNWETLFEGYRAAVDWPAASFWPELQAAYPDALVILSIRDAESWWRSVSSTIFFPSPNQPPAFRAMIEALFASRFTSRIDDRTACIEAFEQHNQRVRAGVAPNRLLEWRATDGWAPLCSALGLPVPTNPFPHVNSSEEFIARRAATRPPT